MTSIHMPKIKVNNINLYYEDHGEGEPVIFIGGFCADLSGWSLVNHRFAKEYRTIVFDNRGAGQSDCPDFLYTIDTFTDDLVSLCGALNINSAHFVGNSMGGMVVQNLAYRYPSIVKSAVISNSLAKINMRLKLQAEADQELFKFPIPLENRIKRILPWLFSIDFLSQEKVVENLIKLMASNPHQISENGYRNQLNAILNFDSSGWIRKISVPTLILYSNDDMYVNLATSKFLIDSIPKSQSYCFKNVGHLPHIERPEEFVNIVKEFFKKL